MYHILIYNNSSYESFDAAYQCGGVIQTNYSVPSPHYNSAVDDILDLIEMVAVCADNKNIVAGVYHNNKFVELKKTKVQQCA